MAWYPEEQWEMIKDSIDKKRTAASAFKQRTHCGKGGSVRFPSDNMTKKELKAMNGEVKSYRLNSAMSWDEFMELPNDLKSDYITNIRDKFGAPDKYIAEMLGVAQGLFSMWLKDLKLDLKIDGGDWNKETFLAWTTGAKTDLVEEIDISEEEETEVDPVEYEWRPIKWDEFKMLSDENKIAYIEWIRKTFRASNKYIGEMMGVHFTTLAKTISGLGIGLGKGSKLGVGDFAKDEFYAWAHSEKIVEEIHEEPIVLEPCVCVDGEWKKAVVKTEEAPKVEELPIPDIHGDGVISDTYKSAPIAELPYPELLDIRPTPIMAVPKSGALSFENNADQIMNLLGMILGTTKVKLNVQWEVISGE